MPREHNFLLGNGEKLTSSVIVPTGGAAKKPPYDFQTAAKRISARLKTVNKAIQSVPENASPKGLYSAVLTMHPRYVSKSDFPSDVLRSMGFEVVGSKARTVEPESWGLKKPPQSAITDDLFIVGKKDSFAKWEENITSWNDQSKQGLTMTHIEDLRPFLAEEKLKGLNKQLSQQVFEIVLHNLGDQETVKAFIDYAHSRGAEVFSQKQRDVDGLTFLPIRTTTKTAKDLANFTLVRVARVMPTIRPVPIGLVRGKSAFSIVMPQSTVLDGLQKAAIFDGGLTPEAAQKLSPWVRYIEPASIGAPLDFFQDHGLGVTSAFLFGHIDRAGQLPVPPCNVDHIRVLDENSHKDRLQLVDVLDRIIKALDDTRYDFVNISVGPQVAVDDDDVSLWTATLDKKLSPGLTVTTVAAGNGGESDPIARLNRVQPPADGVNVMSVGSWCNTGGKWTRAPYSCTGPGRCPGIVKPDGLLFGGDIATSQPFNVLGRGADTEPTAGTSFAAPALLRIAASVRALLGADIGALAIRALLIHRAETLDHSQIDVGWGKFEDNPYRLITCDDNEALIVYQGTLPVGEHLRAPIPVPLGIKDGKIEVTATLVISPSVDPDHASSYTQSGLEVMLRPHSERFSYNDGKKSHHPRTKAFFSSAKMFCPEYSLRDGGHKWEPCIRNKMAFQAKTLKEPCFDIYNHQRDNGGKTRKQIKPMRYALIVSIRASKVNDLYNQIVRLNSGILIPIKPQIAVPISV